ncbi:hypothetical protein [Variovorax terrae]|uniref:DUF2946 domain-containing protein n=1 Tax=Variovorax terrae TaxID=2923278 RepID=A0A9X1VSW9_9BURK|nr:hypothetical protein [Variovorax terrae]MCJ0762345.1 hypothetical protein [Variovorax terrae]
MRHLLLILMIALLPLRGLVGDAMAVEMLSAPGHAMETIAEDDHATRTSGHSDHENQALTDAACAGHAQASDDAASPLSAHADCGTCAACQICHTVALAVVDAAAAAAALPQMPPPVGGERFSSNTPSPGFKPPIS